MKKQRWKILKISSLLVGGLAIVAMPIVSVSCSSSLTTKPDGGNQNNKPGSGTGDGSQGGGNTGGGSEGGSGGSSGGTQTVTISPKINSKINLSGNISSILGLTGNKSEVQEQLQTFVNSDKSIAISNYNDIKSKDKDVNVKINVISGDDSSWSNNSYESWANDLNTISNIKTWAGYDNPTKKVEQNITVDSKKSLKDFLSKNITSIATNSGIPVSGKTVSLADASPAIDETNGNLLVPILLSDTVAKKSKEIKTNNNKYVISIPQANIFLDIKTSITATIVDKQTKYYSLNNNSQKVGTVIDTKPITTTSEFDFDAKFNNSNIQATNMQSDLDLPELQQNTTSNKINVYEKIKDINILKALGWIDVNNEQKLNKHIDGSPIDVNLLKMEVIKTKLNIENGYTPETIIFNMKQRDPSKDDYNGAYHIEIIGLKHNSDSSVLKTMNFYKTINGTAKSSTNTSLQLNVPNAYVIDTAVNPTAGGYKYKAIKKFKSDYQFGIGISISNSPNSVTGIDTSLKKENTWNKFFKVLKDNAKTWDFQTINGFDITFNSFTWPDSVEGNLMKFNLTLKQGFKVMNEITLQNGNKYNTSNSTQGKSTNIEFKFNIDASIYGDSDKSAIGKINNKTPDEMEEWYKNHNDWNNGVR